MVLSKFLDPKNNYAFKRIFGTEKNKGLVETHDLETSDLVS
ncbi:hypothetical protein R3L49_02370 [Wolbachia endosymbiont of Zaprionus taronus]|nr:hypothetical protein [Wolbachia endosymbiont of Zaprionus taronus]